MILVVVTTADVSDAEVKGEVEEEEVTLPEVIGLVVT